MMLMKFYGDEILIEPGLIHYNRILSNGNEFALNYNYIRIRHLVMSLLDYRHSLSLADY